MGQVVEFAEDQHGSRSHFDLYNHNTNDALRIEIISNMKIYHEKGLVAIKLIHLS